MQTNEMEKAYSKAAISLLKGESATIHEILNDLKNLYVSDEDFKGFFALRQFNTNNSNDKKLARYTLYKLESQEQGGSLYDFELDDGTIEHILPESYPETCQEDFTEEEYERNVFMLGNITILEPAKNYREAGDKIFDMKKPIYATSKYAITKNILDPQLTSQNIKSRQAHLA